MCAWRRALLACVLPTPHRCTGESTRQELAGCPPCSSVYRSSSGLRRQHVPTASSGTMTRKCVRSRHAPGTLGRCYSARRGWLGSCAPASSPQAKWTHYLGLGFLPRSTPMCCWSGLASTRSAPHSRVRCAAARASRRTCCGSSQGYARSTSTLATSLLGACRSRTCSSCRFSSTRSSCSPRSRCTPSSALSPFRRRGCSRSSSRGCSSFQRASSIRSATRATQGRTYASTC
mmetsp:Transcript_9388/g.24289  ORF Transcript_9388/g.24289 Transcript_9388/m.24289 type:complete len:232 (-) Transcript_9388:139-834(-)